MPFYKLVVAFCFLITLPLKAYITVSSFTMSIAYTAGQQQPSNRNITVTGTNGAEFRARAVSNPAGWLQVTPLTGTIPAILVVSFDVTNLPNGQYEGLILVEELVCVSYGCSSQVNVLLSVTGAPSGGKEVVTVIAQIADGGSWDTSVNFVNTTSKVQTFTIKFWGDDGWGIFFPLVNRSTAHVYTFQLSPYGSMTIASPGVASEVTQGWASVHSTDGAIAATAVYRQRVKGRPDFEVTVVAVTVFKRVSVPFDNLSGFVSAVAFVNTGASGPVTLTVRDESAAVIVAQTYQIPGGEHYAFPLAALYPIVLDKRGTIEFRSDAANVASVAALGIRFNPSGSMTGLQATPMN